MTDGHGERRKARKDAACPSCSAEFVLYWMHHAVRGHENPALVDWCLGSRVEDAWLSGRATAGRMLGLADPSSRSSIAHQPTLFEGS